MMTKLRTNDERLVKIAVQGTVANAAQYSEFEVAHDGRAHAFPSTGGIVYNVKVGDSVFAWEGDHIEPGVSAILDESKRSSRQNMGFNFLACVGNTARLVSGDAKGERGVVTGHHGGVEHVLIDFDDDTLEKMSVDDKILIESFGQGLKLLDYPHIRIYNLDPRVLELMPLWPRGSDRLEVGVTAIIPAELMGSGMGHNNIGTGDCDIMTHDSKAVRTYKIDQLRFGDFVAVRDHDHSFGRTYRKGAVSIGIVVHSNSILAGHGPGLSTVMTCADSRLVPVIHPHANLAEILKIGRFRQKKRKAKKS